MKVKDVIKFCQERYNQLLCQTCPLRGKQCDYVKKLYLSSAPSHYELLLNADVPSNLTRMGD